MSQSTIKMFNTTGPCVPAKHYMLPALPRLPEEDIDLMIEGEFFFVLHAPRQSGKTTYLGCLINKINSEGKYYAIYCSLMTLKNIKNEDKAMEKVINLINDSLSYSKINALKQKAYIYDSLPWMRNSDTKVKKILINLCEDLDKELLVFFDEADCLTGQALISFLSQIRDGFLVRETEDVKFPRSMALVGVRNFRDYISHVRPDSDSLGVNSPFNIIKESFTLPYFTRLEIGTLYRQHTEACGQVF